MIEAVWNEYVELFPMHLAAQAAYSTDLFLVARVRATLRGDDPATIADDLHERVKQTRRIRIE